MTPTILYLIKANVALMVFYLIYKLMFREDTFFPLRRAAILFIIVASFTYQLPDLGMWIASKSTLSDVVTYYSSVILNDHAADLSTPMALDWKLAVAIILQTVYFIGVGVVAVRCLIELYVLTRNYLKGNKRVINGIRICEVDEEKAAYSFFGWIFISKEQLMDSRAYEIILHEHTHARQLHSLDVFICELMCIVCWFNPFAWWLKKEAEINHEYLADSKVVGKGVDKKEYQYLLIGMKHPTNLAIANLYNHFSVLLLKKRITMLNKKRTSSIGKIKYLMLFVAAALFIVGNNVDAMARIIDSKHVVSVVQPEFPGGQQALMQYLAKSIKYPVLAQEKGITGRVVCQFTVGKDGSIEDIKPGKSMSNENEVVVVGYGNKDVTTVNSPDDPALFKEASRVVSSMPNWTPAKDKDGAPISTTVEIPFTFRLQP